MDMPASTVHELAPQLENGVAPVPEPNEKPALQSPKTVSGETFATRGTLGSLTSSIQRAKTWASGVGDAVRPKVSPGKPDLVVPNLDDYPRGYPALGCYLDSDDAFMMYRRFGQLHARLLLHKQDRLRALEEELFYLDRADATTDEGRRCLKCREDDDGRDPPPAPRRSRAQLLDAIQAVLTEYGQILIQAQQLCAMNRPSRHDHRSVVNYVENEQPLLEGDRDFIYHAEDLVTIRGGRETAWLDAVVEKVLRWYPCRPIQYLFCSETTRRRSSNANIHYFSRPRINFFVTLLITLLILVLLVVPIWLLFYLTVVRDGNSTDTVCIGVLIVSTLLFSCVLSLFTRARRHEILAAAAG